MSSITAAGMLSSSPASEFSYFCLPVGPDSPSDAYPSAPTGVDARFSATNLDGVPSPCTATRVFGRELQSNTMMGPPPLPTKRGAWPATGGRTLSRRESFPVVRTGSVAAVHEDDMDVDDVQPPPVKTQFRFPASRPPPLDLGNATTTPSSPFGPHSDPSSTFVTATDSTSPFVTQRPSVRFPTADHSPLSSPHRSPPSSPTTLCLRHTRSSSITSTSRGQPYARRPTMRESAQTAYPVLQVPASDDARDPDNPFLTRGARLPPKFRRHHSVSNPTFAQPATSPAAQEYAALHSMHAATFADGSTSFRPAHGVSASFAEASLHGEHAAGMPRHGESEADGKLLDCFNVTEDGLMRITAATLAELVSKPLPPTITKLHVIDCRFEYEHEGGRIPGSVNLSTRESLKSYLFSDDGAGVPEPSTSAELGEGRTVIVLHCEFSEKRAPSLACFLRNHDRHLNASVYPRIHYPELYILQGGYHAFMTSAPSLCVPRPGAYVPMLASDLSKCRTPRKTFCRARSFAFGDARLFIEGAGGTPFQFPIKEESEHSSSPCGGGVSGKENHFNGGGSPLPGGRRHGGGGALSFDLGKGTLMTKRAGELGRAPLMRAASVAGQGMLFGGIGGLR